MRVELTSDFLDSRHRFRLRLLYGGLWGVMTGAVLLLASCSGASSPAGDESPAAESPTEAPPGEPSETSSSETAPTVLAAAAAVEAYLGMWRDMAEAAVTSDWQSPSLARHATGDALSAISRGMYADRLNGLVTLGEPVNDPQVTSVDPPKDPTTVLISDCGDSSNWLKYVDETGELADEEPGGRQAITAEVQEQPDGAWRVTRFAVEGVGSC
ncbi:hypothetical protein [Streptomyces specialis]|uniref:hypothetical protein n=1 Tax=Streptomyces specialis TaxID=498367 RepID=UPI000A6E6FCD|nr:hypothetical protein [Streptomyces specialis]